MSWPIAADSFRSQTASLRPKSASVHAGDRVTGIHEPLPSIRTRAWDMRAHGMWDLNDFRTWREEILQSGMPKNRMGLRTQQGLLQRTPIHGSSLQVETN